MHRNSFVFGALIALFVAALASSACVWALSANIIGAMFAGIAVAALALPAVRIAAGLATVLDEIEDMREWNSPPQ